MKDNLKALDGLRGIAAIYVLVHHARLALTQSYYNGLNLHPEKYEWYDKVMVYFFGIFKFGHEAVIVFFVLSGFLIHLKQAKPDYNFEDFKIIKYIQKRIIRIYPTLLVSLLLCFLFDYTKYLFIEDISTSIFSKYNVYNFVCNFFLIPDSPAWGNNSPIWSLKHEWFFYIIYPLLLWLAQKHFSFSLFIIMGLYFCFIFDINVPLINSAAYTLVVWILGCVLAELYQKQKSHLLKWIPYLTLLVIPYFILRKPNMYFPFSDIIFGFITIGFLTFIINEKKGITKLILTKFTWLGAFSYSIYLLHYPFLDFYQTLILNYQPNNILPYHLWYVVLSVIITLPIIYLIYYYTERFAVNYKKNI